MASMAVIACNNEEKGETPSSEGESKYIGQAVGNFEASEWYPGGELGTTDNVLAGCYEDETPAVTAQGLTAAFNHVLEVITDPDQFDLHNALVTYGKRKYGFRPIEDQSPFIERDVFFEEMIIEPMETSYGTPV